jgi:hypothetical protein
MASIVRDSSIILESRFAMMHASKNKLAENKDSLAELYEAFQSDEDYKQALLTEIHARYVTSTKRGNSNVATSIPIMVGLTMGVGDTMQVAAMSDYGQELYNTIGNTTNLDVIDGGGFTNGITSVLETRSFVNKKYKAVESILHFIKKWAH